MICQNGVIVGVLRICQSGGLLQKCLVKRMLWLSRMVMCFLSVAFLHGFAAEELSGYELAYKDNDYQVIIGVKAVKRIKE